jgi:hypothetical protein
MLHPSELCYILLSYAAPFRATLHTTELRLTLNEIRGTLKINGPRSTHCSFADPSDEINEISRNKCISLGPNSGCQGHISFHCTSETYIEPPRKITVWAPVYVLTFFLFYSFLINIMSPAPPIAAALILTALLLIEKTPRNVPVLEKSAKVNHCLFSSTEQLQVAL